MEKRYMLAYFFMGEERVDEKEQILENSQLEIMEIEAVELQVGRDRDVSFSTSTDPDVKRGVELQIDWD